MFMNVKFPLIIEVKYVHVYVHVPIFKKKTWAILERLKKNLIIMKKKVINKSFRKLGFKVHVHVH